MPTSSGQHDDSKVNIWRALASSQRLQMNCAWWSPRKLKFYGMAPYFLWGVVLLHTVLPSVLDGHGFWCACRAYHSNCWITQHRALATLRRSWKSEFCSPNIWHRLAPPIFEKWRIANAFSSQHKCMQTLWKFLIRTVTQCSQQKWKWKQDTQYCRGCA